ncbi:MAG: hypothetical protein JNM85_03570 [Chthonomonas sp.]|nr:hypothetical protein [Chthonomonas sp.]
MRTWAVSGVGCGVLLLALVGCRKAPEPAIRTYSPPAEPFAPSANSGNAYDGYVLAGRAAAALPTRITSASNPVGRARQELLSALGPMLSKVATSSKLPCKVKYVPTKPFSLSSEAQGWALIGRALALQIQSAVREKNYGLALEHYSVAMRFGMDLTGSDVLVAGLGLTIVNNARAALASGLDGMGAGQLQQVVATTKGALDRRPAFELLLKNERESMNQSIDMVQAEVEQIRKLKDDEREKRLEAFQARLGSTGREAMLPLTKVFDSPNELRSIFDGMSREADAQIELAAQRATKSTADRGEWPESESQGKPWGRLSNMFFGTFDGYQRLETATLARCRLLAVYSSALAIVKAQRIAPARLDECPEWARTDPYSGKPFIYWASGNVFKVYSVGADLQDDGGKTDDSFSIPDVTLEVPGQ